MDGSKHTMLRLAAEAQLRNIHRRDEEVRTCERAHRSDVRHVGSKSRIHSTASPLPSGVAGCCHDQGLILVTLGVAVTVALWVMFVDIAVREIKAEMPSGALAAALYERLSTRPAPMKVLLPIDGSEASVAAVHEVAYCPLPEDSTIEPAVPHSFTTA